MSNVEPLQNCKNVTLHYTVLSYSCFNSICFVVSCRVDISAHTCFPSGR